MITIYDVVDHDGELVAESLTAAEAAHEILTSDGREYDIRNAEDGYVVWSRQQVANRPWARTTITSIKSDRAEAEADIFAQVVAAERWNGHPEAVERGARIQAAAQLARDTFADADKDDLIDAIKARYNCHEADVDDAGAIYIADPQTSHWLDDEALIALHRSLA